MKKKYTIIGLIILTGLCVWMIFIWKDIYGSSEDTVPGAHFVKQYFHVPAATVNHHKITFIDLEDRLRSTKHFYENQDFARAGIRIDFSTPEGKKRLKLMEKDIFNKRIEDLVIRDIAHKNGINVTQEEAQMALDRIIETSDKEAVQKRMRLYDYTKEQFAQNIVLDQLYRQKLEDWYNKKYPTPSAIRTRAQEAKKALDKGDDFGRVAQQFSDGNITKDDGGIGTFARGQLTPKVEEFAFSTSEGTISDVIEAPEGLYIVRIDTATNDASGDREMVTLHYIFIKKPSFRSFVDEAVKASDIVVHHPDYRWDNETGFAVFRDPDLLKYEQKIEKMLAEQLTQ